MSRLVYVIDGPGVILQELLDVSIGVVLRPEPELPVMSAEYKSEKRRGKKARAHERSVEKFSQPDPTLSRQQRRLMERRQKR